MNTEAPWDHLEPLRCSRGLLLDLALFLTVLRSDIVYGTAVVIELSNTHTDE